MNMAVAPVCPAAGFPHKVKANGGALIEIGPSDTELSELRDITVRTTAAVALHRLAEAVVERLSSAA